MYLFIFVSCNELRLLVLLLLLLLFSTRNIIIHVPLGRSHLHPVFSPNPSAPISNINIITCLTLEPPTGFRNTPRASLCARFHVLFFVMNTSTTKDRLITDWKDYLLLLLFFFKFNRDLRDDVVYCKFAKNFHHSL